MRREIESAFHELKTHLRDARRVLRSKTPDLVRQEVWGFLLAHVALRALTHAAALGALLRARDPDRSRSRTRGRSPAARSRMWPPFPPQAMRRQQQAHHRILAELRAVRVGSSRGRVVPRGVERKMSDFPLRPRRSHRTRYADPTVRIIVRHRPPKGTPARRYS